jgi:hypothetical protein
MEMMTMDLFEGLRNYMDSPKGQAYQLAEELTSPVLEKSCVDIKHRKIILPDQLPLSIEETAQYLAKQFDLGQNATLSCLVGWLTLKYEPTGLSDVVLKRRLQVAIELK